MLRTRFAADLKTAMKAKDECRVSTLRLILAALKDRDLAARAAGASEPVDDADILKMLDKMIRQRRDSISMYESGARLDLAEREAEEIEVIEAYMPKRMDEDEIEQAVEAIISESGASTIKDMGRTMAALKQTYAGRMDFSKASSLVKSRLAGIN
jgi:uncharacterized protein YqeY